MVEAAKLKLYLVTDNSLSLGRSLLDVIGEALRGGVTIVQLREKDIATREFVELARAVGSLLAPLSVPMIINDRVDVALAAGADGLHLGQSDMTYIDARRLMGTDAIIGLSIENSAQAVESIRLDGLDYVGASPIFSTPTKTDTAPALGLAGLEQIRGIVRVPIVAIGGLNRDNIPAVISAGADGIAVVSAICSAPDPAEAARLLNTIINKALCDENR